MQAARTIAAPAHKKLLQYVPNNVVALIKHEHREVLHVHQPVSQRVKQRLRRANGHVFNTQSRFPPLGAPHIDTTDAAEGANAEARLHLQRLRLLQYERHLGHKEDTHPRRAVGCLSTLASIVQDQLRADPRLAGAGGEVRDEIAGLGGIEQFFLIHTGG